MDLVLIHGMGRTPLSSAAEASGKFKSLVVEVPSIHTFTVNSEQVFDDLAQSLETIEQTTASVTENLLENPTRARSDEPACAGPSRSESDSI